MGTKGMKFDENKLMYSLIPIEATKGMAEIFTFGAQKYAANNWKSVENAEFRYKNALLRHLYAYEEGEIVDPESGFSHLKHILANVSMLLWFETRDRYVCKCGKEGYLENTAPSRCPECDSDRLTIIPSKNQGDQGDCQK